MKVTPAQRIAFLAAVIRRWDVGASAIGSELKTYFPGTFIPSQWRDYEDGVRAVLRYVSGGEVNTHAYLLGLLRDHFRDVRFDDRADDRTRRAVASGTFVAGSKRIELATLLDVERDQMASRVVSAKAAGLQSRLLDLPLALTLM